MREQKQAKKSSKLCGVGELLQQAATQAMPSLKMARITMILITNGMKEKKSGEFRAGLEEVEESNERREAGYPKYPHG